MTLAPEQKRTESDSGSRGVLAGSGGHGPTDIDRLIDERVPGYSLPAPFYISPEFFARDLEAIFASTWIFVASTAEVPEAGDYLTIDIGTYSVIVIRDDDDEIRAHHNVCRHRGTRLLNDLSGSVGNIVCGYHQWTYTPAGDLISAGVQAPGFDRSCFSLRSVNVRVIGGLIFICLSPTPPDDIDEVAAVIEPYLTGHDIAGTKVAAQVDLIEDSNWKLVMENNRECYHCEAGHPELTCTFFPTYGYAPEEIPKRLQPAYQRYLDAEAQLHADCDRNGLPYALVEELSGRPTGFRIERAALDGKGESYTMDGSAASAKLLGNLDTFVLGRASLHVQPNMWFHAMGDHVVTFSLLPLAEDKTLVRTTWLVRADAEEGVDYDLENLTTVWIKTNEQDAAFCERGHLGISSPAYEPGPYAPTESQVDDFVTWYIERLRAHKELTTHKEKGLRR
ncbi:aromatic ring-hydroxylating oxygenase subunit alpha [Brevibacterium oceani]|uniref:aromatic ring-hydroxylating oxygenase subunit alpha n=1 Tax=Brevibacterium oceani TaxID=358099 RepID=UPI001C62890B|nr:aromatic ring-hydroxylating dioxygenase subunit alpha [Brevibacterium oceani]